MMQTSNDNSVNTRGGVGFLGLLGLLFIGLKLGGVITWPWLWVLSPLWIGLALWLVIVLILAVAVVAFK